MVALATTPSSQSHDRSLQEKKPSATVVLAKLTLPKLLERDLTAYESRNAQTVNKYLNLMSGIMRKAEKDGYFEKLPHWTNPFHVGFEIAAIDRETFEPFNIDEPKAAPCFRK